MKLMSFLNHYKYSVMRPEGISQQRWNAMIGWVLARLRDGDLAEAISLS